MPAGTVLNISGGSSISLADVIGLLEELTGEQVPIDQRPAQSGDVARTGGSTDQARELLGWTPSTELGAGLRRQLDWHRSWRGSEPSTIELAR